MLVNRSIYTDIEYLASLGTTRTNTLVVSDCAILWTVNCQIPRPMGSPGKNIGVGCRSFSRASS